MPTRRVLLGLVLLGLALAGDVSFGLDDGATTSAQGVAIFAMNCATPGAADCYSLANDVTGPLAQMPPCPHFPTFTPTAPTSTATATRTPTRTPTTTPVPPLQNAFDTIADPAACNGNNGTTPQSDTSAAVGLNYVVQTVNRAITVHDKSGTLLAGPVGTSTFFSGLTGCTSDSTDAMVLFDKLAPGGGRWIISRPSGDAQNPGNQTGHNLCLAVSTTSDPTGPYYRYAFQISGPVLPNSTPCGTINGQHTTCNDYPKIGIGPGSYYAIGNTNKIFSRTGAFASAFDRSKMLFGTPSAGYFTYFVPSNGRQQFMMLPADFDGTLPPPSPTTNYFIQSQDDNLGFTADQLQVYAFTVNWATTPQPTFGPYGSPIPVQPFNADLCGQGQPGGQQECIRQPPLQGNLVPRLDTLAYGTLMNRFVYRNFGAHETLLMNQTVDVANPVVRPGTPTVTPVAGIRWYELRKSSVAPPCPGGTLNSWCVYQQGTYQRADANDRWLGSIAMDGSGHIALGFNVSNGTNVFPSVHYAGRAPTDPLGELPRGEGVIVSGGGPQTVESEFGDYSQISVDPTDDCTFWHASEYYPSPQSGPTFDWHIRIGAFRFPTCASPTPTATSTSGPSPTVTATPTRTLTVTPTIHPATQTAIAATATVQALTATVTPTIHPATQTAIAATVTVQALTATRTPTRHPATQTALALTATATPTSAVVPPGANPPPLSGQPGVPAASAVGQVVVVRGGVNGTLTVIGSMSYLLVATGPAGTAVNGLPAVFIPTTAGVESFTCQPVNAALQTTCAGTTRGNVLQGATVTVRLALAGGGTADVTGTATSFGATPTATPPALAVAPPPLLPPPFALPPPLPPPPPPAGRGARAPRPRGARRGRARGAGHSRGQLSHPASARISCPEPHRAAAPPTLALGTVSLRRGASWPGGRRGYRGRGMLRASYASSK